MRAVPADEPPPSGEVVEIRVQGDIGDFAPAAFRGFDYVVEPVTTTLRGHIDDEDALTQLCHRIRDAGLDLVSLRRIPPVGRSRGGPHHVVRGPMPGGPLHPRTT